LLQEILSIKLIASQINRRYTRSRFRLIGN